MQKCLGALAPFAKSALCLIIQPAHTAHVCARYRTDFFNPSSKTFTNFIPRSRLMLANDFFFYPTCFQISSPCFFIFPTQLTLLFNFDVAKSSVIYQRSQKNDARLIRFLQLFHFFNNSFSSF